jgi:hypothetical protein
VSSSDSHPSGRTVIWPSAPWSSVAGNNEEGPPITMAARRIRCEQMVWRLGQRRFRWRQSGVRIRLQGHAGSLGAPCGPVMSDIHRGRGTSIANRRRQWRLHILRRASACFSEPEEGYWCFCTTTLSRVLGHWLPAARHDNKVALRASAGGC